jgi:hypothetical protein
MRSRIRLFPRVDSSAVMPILSPTVDKAEAVSKRRGTRGCFSIRMSNKLEIARTRR